MFLLLDVDPPARTRLQAWSLLSEVGCTFCRVGQTSYADSGFAALARRAATAMLGDRTHQEATMATPQNPAGSADAEASLDGQPPPIPDEDGPHDVPDDTVIEKTLPTGPVSDAGGDASSPAGDKPQA
jgi:hypothetical protein